MCHEQVRQFIRLILASSPKFKEVFGKSNVSRARDLPFLIESRKFNYQKWYEKHTDIHGQRTEPTLEYVAFIESWAKRTHIVPPQMALYIEENIRMQKILSGYTSFEEIHSYSIDESFMDVTESLNLFYPDIKDKYVQMDRLAQKLQREVLARTGLYITVGMGDNPLLAKIAIVASDITIYVTQLEYFSKQGLEQLQKTVTMVKEINPELNDMGLLLTMNDNTNHVKDVIEELEESEYDILGKIDRATLVRDSIMSKEAVFQLDPEHKVAKQYQDFVNKILSGVNK